MNEGRPHTPEQRAAVIMGIVGRIGWVTNSQARTVLHCSPETIRLDLAAWYR